MTDSKPEVGEIRGDWDGIEPMEGVLGDEPMETPSGEGVSELAQVEAHATSSEPHGIDDMFDEAALAQVEAHTSSREPRGIDEMFE